MSEGGANKMDDGSALLREILIGLHETEGVGWTRIRNFMACRHKEEALSWREGDWMAIGFRRREAEAAVRRLRPEAMEASRRRLASRGIRVVTRLDPDYPSSLEVVNEPPWVLYALGDWSLAARASIAVVGTRTATAYGRRVAEDLAAALVSAGFVIVSGMARGIDTAAHIGAMRAAGEAGGGTIAVLGTPVDHPYPAENRGLYRQIVKTGLVLSEVPPGAATDKWSFLWRNRIIAGLSHATVVVEAGTGSGALNTADWALKYSRGVFAVPGPITSPKSVGVLGLTRKDGVRLLIDAGDLIGEYAYCLADNVSPAQVADVPDPHAQDDPEVPEPDAAGPVFGESGAAAATRRDGTRVGTASPEAADPKAAKPETARPATARPKVAHAEAAQSGVARPEAAMPATVPGASRRNVSRSAAVEAGGRHEGSPEERRILRLLENAPCTIDELAEKSGIPVGRLHAVLTGLQIAGRIAQRPGLRYEIV